MIDIFLSRPTWIPQDYRRGLDSFLSLLEAHDLRPRTIGATDYPNRGPLDEVISLMNVCRGAIILGYPQISVEKGTIKDKTMDAGFLLPTEWNHIEAGLAYARSLPLLVVHHPGVIRGIFDRGAINSFIYTSDLTEPDWPSSQEIRGALTSWKSDVLVSEPDGTQSPSAPEAASNSVSLEGQELEILEAFGASSPGDLRADTLARHFQMNENKMKYYLENLNNAGYLNDHLNYVTGTSWSLSAKGRTYLVENDLL